MAFHSTYNSMFREAFVLVEHTCKFGVDKNELPLTTWNPRFELVAIFRSALEVTLKSVFEYMQGEDCVNWLERVMVKFFLLEAEISCLKIGSETWEPVCLIFFLTLVWNSCPYQEGN